MADIDSIIAGANGNTKYDFSAFGDPVKSFFDASKQRAEFDQRRAFKDGVPVDANGQPDFSAISKTFFEKGDIAQGLAASKMDLERQKLKYGMESAGQDFPSGPSAAPAQPAIFPPSANRGAVVSAVPQASRGGGAPQAVAQPGPSSPQGDQPGSIVGAVSAAGIPDELAGPVIAQISALTKTDPNATLPPQMTPRVQQVVQAAAQRLKAGQPQQPTGLTPAPQASPAPPQAAPASPPQPATDPTLGGLVPAGRTPQQQLEMLSRRVASGLFAPEVAKVYETRIKALQDAISPTPDMKNAAASGKSLEDYQNRGDEQTTQRDILTKSLLPKLDKSQESATAARDDIDSIHRAREELDKTGGIISGSFAEKRLQLAKLASFLGVQNADKIANTEAYTAAVGQRVAAMVKAFGSGTAISDGDRRFASEMAGGRIGLDESSMRRILDIGERAARGKIDNHNKLVDNTINANDALKPARDTYRVNAPGAYTKPAAPDAYEKARDAISKGAPRDAVIQRLQKAGFDPAKL